MKTFTVRLESNSSKSFMATKAAQSMDIDVEKKLSHKLTIEADISTDYNIGLIIGNSGSGKTTLAREMFGKNCFDYEIDYTKTIVDLFPEDFSYKDISGLLNSVGLSQVVCWLRPMYTLSNGQKFRAEAALKIAMAKEGAVVCIDEWTSVVDRTVAKIMSHAIQKAARKYKKKFVLASCHHDVIEWLAPDWVIDCNDQQYHDRRLLRQPRKETLKFDIHEVDKKTWGNFSRYHYLNENLPGGKIYTFGLFHEDKQIGFQCFANYVPGKNILHSNRTVIHPDYVGLGLGGKLINKTSSHMLEKYRVKIMAKFSSVPIHKMFQKSDCWKLVTYGYVSTPASDRLFNVFNDSSSGKSGPSRNKTIRQKVLWFSYVFSPKRQKTK